MSNPRTDPPPARVSAHAILVAASFAAFALLWLVFRNLPGGITEKEEGRIFILGSVLVPLAGLLGSWVTTEAKQRFFPNHPLFNPLLAFGHAAFWAVAVHQLRALSPLSPAPAGDGVNFYPLVKTILVAWVAMSALLMVICALTRRMRLDTPDWQTLERWNDGVLPFLVAAVLIPFVSPVEIPRNVLALLAIAGFGSVLHQELVRFPRQRVARYAFDGLVLVGITVILFDAGLDADIYHYNFYLGPVEAVRGGRSLLVDVNCQYGVGVIYFIAWIFDLHLRAVPASILGFSVVVSALAIVQKWVLYGSLRAITRSAAFSALVVGLMITVTRFEPGGATIYPSMYPSTGGLRFLPGFVLLGCLAMRARFPERRSVLFVLEALVIGGTSAWSFESFVYVAGAYAASLVYEAFHVPSRRDVVKLLKARLVPAAIAVALFHVSLAFYTRARAGEWPHWDRYFGYILLYSEQENGALPIETWQPWVPVLGIYVVTLVALGYRRLVLCKADLKGAYAVVFAMSALGVAQFTYYVGRSHVYNLVHVSLPAFFVAGYWLVAAAHQIMKASDALRRSFVFICYGVATYLALCSLPELARKYDHTWLGYLMANREWDSDARPPSRITDAASLIETHARGKRRVAFFSAPDIDVQVLLRVHKTSVWPESYPVQDFAIPAAKTRILTTDTGLSPGDVIFVDTGSPAKVNPDQVHLAGVDPIDQELFNALAARFRFEVVDARPSGVAALRLLPR